MAYPLKPDVCVQGDRLAVFIGADYKLLELDQADRFCRLYQSELAKLRKHLKQQRLAARRALQTSTATKEPSHG